MSENTEGINEYSKNITEMDTYSIAKLIHIIDVEAYESINTQLNNISNAVEVAVNSIKNGGRVIYVGAGTSGRIAAQDVIELKPTYNIGKESFIFIMAGGIKALYESVENSEDIEEDAINTLKNIDLSINDVLFGVTASGNTPFVASALKFAKNFGCKTILMVNNKSSDLKKYSDICIELLTGPEVIQGSTRMKAGTAQKMSLNMFSTAVAIKLNRTLDNTMSNMNSWYNEKLKKRAINILVSKFNLNMEDAKNILKANNYNISLSIKYINSKHNDKF